MRLGLFLLDIYLNIYAAKNCKEMGEKTLEKPYKPVYDIIHYHIPQINLHIPDYLLCISFLCASIKYWILPCDNFYLYLNLDSLLYSYLLRSITTQLTIMPTCMLKPASNFYNHSWLWSTHDLMFSGHAIAFSFFGKILEEKEILILSISGKLIQFVFPISLVLARQHYTNDIIVSMIVYNFLLLQIQSNRSNQI